MTHVDLNCDLGEGVGDDARLMPLVSSANIACGGHAGDATTMRAAVRLAVRHGVSIGAHPGYDDPAHFGRRPLALPPAEVYASVLRQVRALHAVAASEGATLRHVKPHGALYHAADADAATAHAVVTAVAVVTATATATATADDDDDDDATAAATAAKAAAKAATNPPLIIVGPPAGRLRAAALALGLRFVAEGFIDRRYRADGTLVPRDQPDATIETPDAAADQAVGLIRDRRVLAPDGRPIPLDVRTLCVHGDGPHAAAVLTRVRQRLAEHAILVRAF